MVNLLLFQQKKNEKIKFQISFGNKNSFDWNDDDDDSCAIYKLINHKKNKTFDWWYITF